MTEKVALLTTKMAIKPEHLVAFADWQSEFNVAMSSCPGFVSLEVLSPEPPDQPKWLLVQRFSTPRDLDLWRQSKARQDLMAKLAPVLISKETVEEVISSTAGIQGGVTEVFITKVPPKNEREFREWIAKVQSAEAKFPGFRGVYVQSPARGSGENWITLLQFDTPDHLDSWLNSAERRQVFSEAEHLIEATESHRMMSPYAGWFASIAKGGELPPVWKQSLIVLLILFPIVMMELKYLNPAISFLDVSPQTFIGNTISVFLISWPGMPIAIYFLRWWMVPARTLRLRWELFGDFLLAALYLIEIWGFWKFF